MSLEFDGYDPERVVISAASSINNIFSGGGSVCGWVYVDSRSFDINPILTKGQVDGDDFLATHAWTFSCGLDVGYDHISFNHKFSSSSAFWYGDDTISEDTWYHLAVTYNKGSTGNDPELYVDGVSQSVSENIGPVGTADDDSSYDAWLGSANVEFDSSNVIDGTLSDIRMYNRILSAAEIQTIYNCMGHDTIVDGLVARWLMNEASPGTGASGSGVVKDCGPFGNHGTPNDSPLYRADRLSFRRRVA